MQSAPMRGALAVVQLTPGFGIGLAVEHAAHGVQIRALERGIAARQQWGFTASPHRPG
jgi:hypothetical protein